MVIQIKIPKPESSIVDSKNEEDRFFYIDKWCHLDSDKNIVLYPKCIIVLCETMDPSIQIEIPNVREDTYFESIRTKLKYKLYES